MAGLTPLRVARLVRGEGGGGGAVVVVVVVVVIGLVSGVGIGVGVRRIWKLSSRWRSVEPVAAEVAAQEAVPRPRAGRDVAEGQCRSRSLLLQGALWSPRDQISLVTRW